MTKQFTQFCVAAIFMASLCTIGCEGNTGVVPPPEVSAEEQAALEARQAEYSKSMAESYGKGKTK